MTGQWLTASARRSATVGEPQCAHGEFGYTYDTILQGHDLGPYRLRLG